MRPFFLLLATSLFFGVHPTSAVEFYEWPDEFDSVEVIYPGDSGEFYFASNLIQGAGLGFEEDEPHEEIGPPGGGPDSDWVTTADCGFPADFIECVGMPIIELDLGTDVPLDEFSVWEYSGTNTNGAREFELRFATDAEGKGGFGTSIDFIPTFEIEDYFDFAPEERRSFEFGQVVTARYVEVTLTDNWFDDPGDGTGENGWGPGGDRVGLGEIAFRIPEVEPDPLAPLDNGTLTDPVERADYVHDVLGTWVGDSNLDGEFNSGDLVMVFAAGLYEVDAKASWVDGDWNGDMRFGSGDLVAAFSDGGFEQGPRPAVAAVPEPTGIGVVITFALIAIPTLRRRASRSCC